MSNDVETRKGVEAQFQLAKAWGRAGNAERALAGYRQVLTLDPLYVAAWEQLGNTLLTQGRLQEAMESYGRALEINPEAFEARVRYNYLRQGMSRFDTTANGAPPRENHVDGKLNLNGQTRPRGHRSGWAYALQALEPLHNERGILFDGFIEDRFAWQHRHTGVREPAVLDELRRTGMFQLLATSEEQGLVPYKEPWVGVLHNPPNMPNWFHYQEAPQSIFEKEIWKRSEEWCRGLFVLSGYAAGWVRETTGLPVTVLHHTTDTDVPQFEFAKFLANRNKQIVQVGWWLRQLSAIYRLPLARHNPLGYEKVRLVPQFFDQAAEYLNALMARELEQDGRALDTRYAENTRELDHLTADEYDALLAENIAFAWLYDASGNNLVVECIARATPLLINPLPAVVEYLGEDYPLYMESLEEAADKALEVELIARTHEYLLGLETRRKLGGEYFLQSVRESPIYKAIY